jgi:hypothetical protein
MPVVTGQERSVASELLSNERWTVLSDWRDGHWAGAWGTRLLVVTSQTGPTLEAMS